MRRRAGLHRDGGRRPRLPPVSWPLPSPRPSWRSTPSGPWWTAGTRRRGLRRRRHPRLSRQRATTSRARPPSSTRTSPPRVLAEQLDADMLDHPHRRGEGGHQLRQARPEVVWTISPPPRPASTSTEGQFAPGSMLPKVQAAVSLRRVQARPRCPHHPAGEGRATASPARPAPASTSKSGSDKSPNVPYNLYKRFARKGKPFVCFFSPFSAFSPLSLKIFQQLWLCFQFFFSFARCVLLENFV